MKTTITLFALLFCLTTVSAENHNGPDAPLLPSGPAYAISADSLPAGRHQVSSYRNGSSISVVVEDRAIQSLEIDGEKIPAAEYDKYQDRVEELLGGSGGAGRTDRMRFFRWEEEDLDGMEENLERLGESFEFRFENLEESLEKMTERFGASFERMFDGDGENGTMRFEFRGDGDWDIDSSGGVRIFKWKQEDIDPKGINPDAPAGEHGEAEEELREMETMIEQMERRKARMKAELEERKQNENRADTNEKRRIIRAEREKIIKARAERREVSYEVIVEQLEREGLMKDVGRLRKLSVDDSKLKVNGKKASPEAYARFQELYEQQTGGRIGKGTSISIRKN